MDTFSHQLFSILTTSPGSLMVHLILAFSVVAALQAVWIAKQSRSAPSNRRLAPGITALLAGQLVLFFSSGLVWLGIASPQSFLPPLDRAVSAWSLIWIVWLWTGPQNPRAANAANALSNLLALLFLFVSINSWAGQNQGVSFNLTVLDWGWGIFTALIIVTGMILMLMQRPPAWGAGMTILLLNLLGIGVHFLFGDPSGDFSAPLRLAQIISFPLLPILAVQLTTESPGAVHAAAPDQTNPRNVYTPELVRAWLQLAVKSARSESIGPALTEAVAQTLLADFCFLLPIPTDARLTFRDGYDRAQDEPLSETSIDRSRLPALTQAVLHGRVLRVNSGESTLEDLQTLAISLGLKETGNLLAVPLRDGDQLWGSLLLLSPYTQTDWGISEQNYLTACADWMVHLLESSSPAAQNLADRSADTMLDEIHWLRQQMAQLEEERDRLAQSLNEIKTDAAPAPQIEALLALQQESQTSIQQLQADNEKLQSALEVLKSQSQPGSAEMSRHLESELHQALEECAHLQNALAGANSKIIALEKGFDSTSALTLDDKELILATLEELRQPITSIIGYTDILLSESVGQLDRLQLKFMERMRAANGRMHYLVDELNRTLLSGDLDFSLEPVTVDLIEIIDAAIVQSRELLSAKDITLQIDLPEGLPPINADRDAMEQIVVQLMNNAGTVSPVNSLIHLRVHEESGEGSQFLLLQITDSGGGIAADDLHRVFWRHFHADNPVIPGIGDDGIGLAIARALVEAHGGRIWAESVEGQSATFNVLLPVRFKPTARPDTLSG